MNEYVLISNNELYHYGVKGMKWGVRKTYRSTSIRSALARRSNDKIDASFKKWNDGVEKRDKAIELGKKATVAKIAYEKDRSNKQLKSEYKTANKEYKKALSKNTTYRKGIVRSEVGKDLSRKYLSEAKKIKKQLDSDPTNKKLSKQYADLMSKHDIERAKARRAPEVAQKRSARIDNIKRGLTRTVKTAAATTAVGIGLHAVNRYLQNHEVTLNGKAVRFGTQSVSNVADMARKARNLMGYMY